MTKFLAVFDDPSGERHLGIYYSWSEYHKDTWNPECKQILLMDPSTVKGKTYIEKKRKFHDLAVEFSNYRSELYPLTYSENQVIAEFFERYAKRYGLVRELKENGIL